MTGTSPTSTRWRCRGRRCSASRPPHVEAIGRITPGCLGLWNDATEAALKPILASVRKHSKTAVAMQLAHAGRKASSHTPWDGGQLIPLVRRRLADGGAVRRAAQGGRGAAARARCGGPCAHPRRLRRGGQARRAARHRRASNCTARTAICCISSCRRSPTSAPTNMAARLQNRMRYPLEVFDAVRAAFPAQQAGRRQGVGDRLGRGRLGSRADHRIRRAN